MSDDLTMRMANKAAEYWKIEAENWTLPSDATPGIHVALGVVRDFGFQQRIAELEAENVQWREVGRAFLDTDDRHLGSYRNKITLLLAKGEQG